MQITPESIFEEFETEVDHDLFLYNRDGSGGYPKEEVSLSLGTMSHLLNGI